LALLTLGSLMFGAALVAVALIAITFHEAAHAYAAWACGDDTAKRLRRTSLNPIRHIDLIGTIVLPALLYALHAPFLIGWAKPVPVDWSKLRNWHRDMGIVAAAGPAANFALAAISAAALTAVPSAAETLRLSMILNLSLGVLNLIPIPPLDGSKVLAAFLPEAWALKILGARRQRQPLKWIGHNQK
jgi:Zn-dependent protease